MKSAKKSDDKKKKMMAKKKKFDQFVNKTTSAGAGKMPVKAGKKKMK